MFAVLVLAVLSEMLLVTAGILFHLPADELSGLAILLLLPFCICIGLMVDVPGPARIKRFLKYVVGRQDRRKRKQDIP
jgi:hypothetical protein